MSTTVYIAAPCKQGEDPATTGCTTGLSNISRTPRWDALNDWWDYLGAGFGIISAVSIVVGVLVIMASFLLAIFASQNSKFVMKVALARANAAKAVGVGIFGVAFAQILFGTVTKIFVV